MCVKHFWMYWVGDYELKNCWWRLWALWSRSSQLILVIRLLPISVCVIKMAKELCKRKANQEIAAPWRCAFCMLMTSSFPETHGYKWPKVSYVFYASMLLTRLLSRPFLHRNWWFLRELLVQRAAEWCVQGRGSPRDALEPLVHVLLLGKSRSRNAGDPLMSHQL